MLLIQNGFIKKLYKLSLSVKDNFEQTVEKPIIFLLK